MPQIVYGGPEAYSALVYGTPNAATASYIENQFQKISNVLTEAGSAFMERGRQIFNDFYGSEAIRLAKSAMRATQHMFQRDTIYAMDSISQLQQAKPTMQRWIMACPEVRTYYHQQRCDGYSDSYVDSSPGLVGEQHHDYQKVMNGILQETDDPEIDWKYTTWLHDTDDVDPQLSFSEQVTILSVWDLVKGMMKPGKEDPTSPYCTNL